MQSHNHVDKAAYHMALAADELRAANRNASYLLHLHLLDLIEQATKLAKRTQAVACAVDDDRAGDTTEPTEERE